MTVPITTTPAFQFERDEHGNFQELTADQCMTVFTEWASGYPSARFVVAGLDGMSSEILGWGLALPEGVFAHLPSIAVSGRFRTAGRLVALLRHSFDARLIWVDPEPQYWPDDDEDNR